MTSRLTTILTRMSLGLAALAGALQASAQTTCDPFWTGSWDTSFGQLRLIEDGEIVYGDYGNVGTIKGRLDGICGDWLRGIFERKDGRWGYFEFVETGDHGNRFTGRWTWSDTTLPSWENKSGSEWNGTVTDKYPPPILNFTPGESRDPMSKTPFPFQRWMDLVDRKAINAERAQARADQKAQIEANRQAAAARASQPSTPAGAPVTSGYILNDGYGSILAVGRTFDKAKAETAVSMQEHVQMVSSPGRDRVLELFRSHDFELIGSGVYEAAGVFDERLRASIVRKGDAIIITFRGTGGDDFGETLVNAIRSDARTKLMPPPILRNDPTLKNGETDMLVHTGFYESYLELRASLVNAMRNEPKSNLFVFGHSLGGAMATLMAADMSANYANKFTTITHIVSGSPRVGNADFVRYFERRVPDNLRLAVNKDPVPLIPDRGRIDNSLKVDNYVHVGRLLVIEEGGKPINGDDIRIDPKWLTLRADFSTFHDNMMYLRAVRNMKAKQPTNPVLSPTADNWVIDTARKERARSR